MLPLYLPGHIFVKQEKQYKKHLLWTIQMLKSAKQTPYSWIIIQMEHFPLPLNASAGCGGGGCWGGF